MKPVRVTRDEIDAKTDKVSSDQIRRENRIIRSAEKQPVKGSREPVREREIKPMIRPRKQETDAAGKVGRPVKESKLSVVERITKPMSRESKAERGKSDALSVGLKRPSVQGKTSESGKVRLDVRPKPRPSEITSTRRIARPEDYDSRIVINGDNNVIVQGDITSHRPRPYIPPKLWTNVGHFRRSRYWRDCGGYFSLTFSLNSCGRIACVPYRGYYGFTYYYPRYHRRYIFVSIGGWWPRSYRYRRYYWYGCHPYYWYGPTVIREQPVIREYNTYNTYNYYGTQTAESATESVWRYPFGDESYDVSDFVDKISPVDEPEYATASDLCFARAVELFAAGDYTDAAAQFREAIRISPDDVILPFTYSQALFADGDYAHAAGVLRAALANLPEDELTIYYPRGLYQKEEDLLEQIDALSRAAESEPFAGDYYLLLGYHYLGLGDLEKAAGPLSKAVEDPANRQAAEMLLTLAAKLEETVEVEE